MITLGIDTSSKSCSCALVGDGRLLGEFYLNTGLTHSSVLSDMVSSLFSQSGVSYKDLCDIVITQGPGSYTGLRIGMSFVKGMAMGLKVPCTTVSTLAALAYGALPFCGTVCAALDARVGQFFAAIFEADAVEVRRLSPDSAISAADLKELVPDKTLLIGDGAQLLYNTIENESLVLAGENVRFTKASAAIAAAQRFGKTYKDAFGLVPDYHRKSQAEREAEAKRRDLK